MSNQSINVDELFDNYRYDKFDLLDDLNPTTIKAFVSPDDGCMRQMGNLDGDSSYACDKCLQIGRLVDIGQGVPKVLTIETGSLQGVTFGITETPNVLYDIRWDTEAEMRFEIINAIENLSSCGLQGTIKANRYIASDSWLNESLISWEIERIFEEKEMPHINPVMLAYVCGGKGFTIDHDGLKPLVDRDKLSEKEAISILLQIGSFFLALKESKFTHNAMTIDKLYTSNRACGYQYENHKISGPFTLYIRGFHLSSININDIRLIPSTNGRGVDLDYAVSQFKPIIRKCKLQEVKIGEDFTESCGNDSDLIYKYVDNGPILFTSMRYSGYPIFGGSYDIYSILVSLLSWAPFRCAVKSSESLTAIIRKMFPGNLPGIKEENITCTYKVAATLSNTWLYCNAIEKLFENIKQYTH